MKERKIFLGLSIAALALAGCSQNELISDPGSLRGVADRSISFGSYLSRPTSRATGVDLAEFKTKGSFKVWGYVTTNAQGLSDDLTTATSITLHTALSGGSALNGTDQFRRMEENDATGTATGKFIWSSGKKYYWPADGLGKMSFYALSNTSASVTAPTNTVGATFDYVVGSNGMKADADKQEDLIAAQVYNKAWATDNESSKIVLDFKHLLTQVRFSAQTSDASYRVKILSLKVTGANNEGTFTFDISDTGIGSWAIADTSKRANYTYFDATVMGAQNGDFANGFPKDDADPEKHFISTTAVDFPLFGTYTATNSVPDKTQALIVLPSVAKTADGKALLGLKGVTITVSYQCYILSGNQGEDGSAVAHWVPDGTVLNRTIELTDKEMWTMNKKVCYILTLFTSNTGKILYTPIVSDWTDQNGDSNLYPDKDYTAPTPPVP